MKKIFIFIAFLVLILFISFIGANIFRYYRINEKYKDNLDYIVDMGGASTIEDCKYVIVNDSVDVHKLESIVCGEYICGESECYSFLNVVLNRQGDTTWTTWSSKEYTYIDILTHEKVATVNYDSMIKKQSSYGACTPLSYFYDENGDLNVFCHYFYQKDILGRYCKSEGLMIYNFGTKKVSSEDVKLGSGSELQEYARGFGRKEFEESINHHIITNCSYLKSNNLDEKILCISASDKGSLYIIPLSNLPNENERLYSEFCDLKKYKDNVENGYVVLVMSYKLNPDEIVEMLIEDDETVSYEGVYIEAEDSIDGENHFITNYEQYMHFFDKDSGLLYYSDEYKSL